MKTILTQEYLKNMFDYRDGHLYWKQDRLIARIGDQAGTKTPAGYIQIGLARKIYLAHRLIFMWHHGYIPETVDHINNISYDNRIENLRAATISENNCNRRRLKPTKYPAKGIYKHSKYEKYCVEIHLKGKRIHVGIFNTLDKAVEASNNARKELHGAFAKHD